MPTIERRSVALRRVVLGFMALVALVLAASTTASVTTGDWQWFGRSGALVTALGLVLASRKVLIARADLLDLLSDMERVDGTERTARLDSFKRLHRDLDRQVLEKAGFALLVAGTLIWGFGDLIGRL